MATPYDVAVIPTQAAVGICLDCDRTQPTTKNGRCSVCGSNSIIRRGAITELRKQLRTRDRREGPRKRRANVEQEPKPERYVCQECGEEFDGPRTSHGRGQAAHDPACDGNCRSCPVQVEVECGPVVRVGVPRQEGGEP